MLFQFQEFATLLAVLEWTPVRGPLPGAGRLGPAIFHYLYYFNSRNSPLVVLFQFQEFATVLAVLEWSPVRGPLPGAGRLGPAIPHYLCYFNSRNSPLVVLFQFQEFATVLAVLEWSPVRGPLPGAGRLGPAIPHYLCYFNSRNSPLVVLFQFQEFATLLAVLEWTPVRGPLPGAGRLGPAAGAVDRAGREEPTADALAPALRRPVPLGAVLAALLPRPTQDQAARPAGGPRGPVGRPALAGAGEGQGLPVSERLPLHRRRPQRGRSESIVPSASQEDFSEREMFYLTTHSTHFIYGYMASDIWLTQRI